MIQLEFGIVLCAGLGLRLRPLTDVAPKPLLRFLDQPIAEYALNALRNVGVARVGVNAHHLPEQLDEWLRGVEDQWAEQSGKRPRSALVVEEALQGTGGGALGVWNALGSPQSTVAIINGDVVADFPLETMLKVHRRTGAAATLLTLPPLPGEAAVYLDEHERFIAQLPSPDDTWTSTRYEPSRAATFGGVYLVEPHVFKGLEQTNSCLIRHGIGPLLAQGEIVAAVPFDGFWADLGTPRRFLDASTRVLQNPDLMPTAPVRKRADNVYVADHRSLPADVVLQGPAFIAKGAQIGRGATIGPNAIIGENCRVAADVTVANAILMDGANATADTRNRIICGAASVRVS